MFEVATVGDPLPLTTRKTSKNSQVSFVDEKEATPEKERVRPESRASSHRGSVDFCSCCTFVSRGISRAVKVGMAAGKKKAKTARARRIEKKGTGGGAICAPENMIIER